MTIQTQTEAEEAILAVALWLQSNTPLPAADDPAPWLDGPCAQVARGWCHKLLNSAKADDMGGCKLCLS